jgi:hypothetical protein
MIDRDGSKRNANSQNTVSIMNFPNVSMPLVGYVREIPGTNQVD